MIVKNKAHQSVFFLVFLLFIDAGARQASDESIVFPLAKGTVWIYEGKVEWTDSANNPHEKKVTWKMEITDVLSRDHVTIAVLKGFPSDLTFYEEGKKQGDYALVRVGLSKYYLLKGARLEELLKKAKEKDAFLINALKEEDLFLDYPLSPGKVWGEAGQITRSDMSYFWFVESNDRLVYKDVKGISPSRELTRCVISFLTRPDRQTLEIVPGVGIMRYFYAHHGTKSTADVKLAEFHPGRKS